jgi:hypothetical protein
MLPIIIAEKVFFNLFVDREESKFARKKWKMTLSLHEQFNGSAINVLASRDETTLGPSLARDHEQI